MKFLRTDWIFEPSINYHCYRIYSLSEKIIIGQVHANGSGTHSACACGSDPRVWKYWGKTFNTTDLAKIQVVEFLKSAGYRYDQRLINFI